MAWTYCTYPSMIAEFLSKCFWMVAVTSSTGSSKGTMERYNQTIPEGYWCWWRYNKAVTSIEKAVELYVEEHLTSSLMDRVLSYLHEAAVMHLWNLFLRCLRRESDKKWHKCPAEHSKPVHPQKEAIQCVTCNNCYKSKGGLAVHTCRTWSYTSCHFWLVWLFQRQR